MFGTFGFLFNFANENKDDVTIMPKILLYITAKIIWQFLFWNTDYNVLE